MKRIRTFGLLLICLGAGCSQFSPGQDTQQICGTLFFAHDPDTGQCRPIMACGADAQLAAGWRRCDNPCHGLSASECSADNRCQPVSQLSGQGEVFAGCNPVEQRRPCEALDSTSCQQNRSCKLVESNCFCELRNDDHGQLSSQVDCTITGCNGPGKPVCAPRSCYELDSLSCGSTNPDCRWDGSACKPAALAPCAGLDQGQCLGRHDCRAVGTSCFCTDYMSCDCQGGAFISCEPESPTGGACLSSSDCPNGFGCQLPGGLACKGPNPDPAVCAGQCAPTSGCQALSEGQCDSQPNCQPKYQEVCVPPPGFVGPPPQPGDPYDPNNPGNGGGTMGFFSPDGGVAPSGGPVLPTDSACVPTQIFAGCRDLGTTGSIVPDRSLLILDPAVLDDPAYDFTNMMRRLAGTDPTAMVQKMMATYTEDTPVNGRVVPARLGARAFLSQLGFGNQPRQVADQPAMIPIGPASPDVLRFRPVAITNRIDLVSAQDCGEARIVYVSDFGRRSPSQRMTLIMEFGVPSDGAGCRTIAHRWADLSRFATLDPRYATALKGLTDEMFRPERLNQLRTNEFLDGFVPDHDWEQREFKLVNGQLVPQPCKNSADPRLSRDPVFLDWVRANQTAILLRAAPVPTQFLAGSSITTDINAINLPPDLAELNPALNMVTCNGCHSSSTGTSFVHLSERRFDNVRSTPSAFLQGDLVNRGHLLEMLLGDSPTAQMLRTRERPPSVH